MWAPANLSTRKVYFMFDYKKHHIFQFLYNVGVFLFFTSYFPFSVDKLCKCTLNIAATIKIFRRVAFPTIIRRIGKKNIYETHNVWNRRIEWTTDRASERTNRQTKERTNTLTIFFTFFHCNFVAIYTPTPIHPFGYNAKRSYTDA